MEPPKKKTKTNTAPAQAAAAVPTQAASGTAQAAAAGGTSPGGAVATLDEAVKDWSTRNVVQHPVTATTDQHLYPLNNVHADWLLPQYRQRRFKHATKDPSASRILYRPAIVNELYTFIQSLRYNGLMVRGPQGIGKSFTLLNLYRRLVSEGHLVAFLPQTGTANSYLTYAEAVTQALRFPNLDIDVSDGDKVNIFIKKIVAGLPEGKKFYFILDQINEVFDANPNRKITQLKAPHDLIARLQRLGVVPIISASANNSTAYKDNHEGFEAWDHPVPMNDEELGILFPTFPINDDTSYLTGKVPLCVSEYMQSDSPDIYKLEARIDATNSLLKLLNESFEEDEISIRSACAHAVLGLPMSFPRVFDRKSSTLSRADRVCRPLFPLVKEVYREVCIKEVMELTRQNEYALGEACNDTLTPVRAKATLFELMVICRLYAADLSHSELPPRSDFAGYFEGAAIPLMDKDGMWVPKQDKFPAIDFLWKYSDEYWGVQVHTGINHAEVFHQFKKMCEESGLAGKTIRLIWLSQNKKIAAWAKRCCIPTTQPPVKKSKPLRRLKRCQIPTRQPIAKKSKPSRTSQPLLQVNIQVHALHIGELGACMDGFPWTNNE